MTAPPQTPGYRKNVMLWRAHNQRRWQLERDVLAADERAPFVCECTSGDCLSAMQLTMFELEAAHLRPNWTAVLPDHVMTDDRNEVIVRYDHYWVVELGGTD